jgi:GTP-binding protein
MALIDHVILHATAGRGGDGVVRWMHTKEKAKAGPGGGDGGRGGDVVLVGVRDLAALAQYRFTKKFRAEKGGNGENNERHGADGEDVILKVPVGTVARVPQTNESYEILSEGQREVVFKGGVGGFGNAHFKSSVNQNPFQSREGKPGQAGDIEISLKLIADVGFIGFPNAGKSSLLNELTNARSKVANYAFTTLDPNLGDFYGYILADIPGLIEGASSGKGLGSRFLKHIERNRFLVHLVSAEQEDLVSAYRAIRNELTTFGRGLAEKRELVVLSKVDVLAEGEQEKALKALSEAAGTDVIPLSILDSDLVKKLSDRLTEELRKE